MVFLLTTFLGQLVKNLIFRKRYIPGKLSIHLFWGEYKCIFTLPYHVHTLYCVCTAISYIYVCKKATHTKASTSEIVWLNFVFGWSCTVNVVDVYNKDLSTFIQFMNEWIQVRYISNYNNFKIKQRVAKLYTKFRQ